jgi:FtsZ-binding cell division protein ZapB
MAADSMVEEIVFKQSGIEDIEAKVASLFEELQTARRGQEALTKALGDPIFTKAAREVEQLRRANQQLADSQRATERLAERTRAVYSGDYIRQLREEVRLKDELRRVEALERAEALRGRFGRVGGAVAGALTSRAGGMAMGAAGLAGATVWSNARQGMEGTAELAAFRNEVALAQRSLAGAFKPALEGATSAATRVRRVFDGLSGSEQNMVMGGTFMAMLAGGGLMARMANNIATRATGVGLGTLAFGSAGGGAGSVFGQAVGAYAGARGLGGMAGRVLPYAAPVAVAAAAARGATSDESYYKMGREAGQSKLAATGLGYVSELAEAVGLDSLLFGEGKMRQDLKSRKVRDINDPALSESYYRLRREAGEGRGEAAFGYLMDSGAEFFGAIGEKERADLRAKKMRTIDFGGQRLTQQGGGFEELGGAFDRATIARDQLAASDYTLAGDKDKAKDTGATLESIDKSLKELVKLQESAAPSPEKKQASWMSHKSG